MNNISQLIESAEIRIENLERIVNPAAACIESHAWIVCYPGSTTAYAFDVIPEGRKFRATNARVEACEKVNRFTKPDAITVAAACGSTVEGGAKELEARYYRDVCREELVILTDMVAMLRKASTIA